MYLIKLNTLYLVDTNNKWTNDPRRALQFSTYMGALNVAQYYVESTVEWCELSKLQPKGKQNES